jgi:uncharacterized protein YbjT (DUF2867 family)
MRVIVIGATGATGKELVDNLLADGHFSEVIVLVRRKFFPHHSKLTEVVVDFGRLEQYSDAIQGDFAVSCLGTTLKDAGSKEMQCRIDLDIPQQFAAIAHANGINHFLLLSSMGANSNAPFFYTRMKGVLEENIRRIGFQTFLVLQPSILIRPNSNRLGERIVVKVLLFFNKIGLAQRYQPLHVKDLAQAIKIALLTHQGIVKVFSLREIKQLIADKFR